MHIVHASRLSAYLRWEFTSQAATNVPAGEDIRIVDLDRHPTLAADTDVWIFDDAVGVKMWQPTAEGPNGVARATEVELDAESGRLTPGELRSRCQSSLTTSGRLRNE